MDVISIENLKLQGSYQCCTEELHIRPLIKTVNFVCMYFQTSFFCKFNGPTVLFCHFCLVSLSAINKDHLQKQIIVLIVATKIFCFFKHSRREEWSAFTLLFTQRLLIFFLGSGTNEVKVQIIWGPWIPSRFGLLCVVLEVLFITWRCKIVFRS